MSGPLRNSRHEKFAQLVASGMSQAQAYIQSGYAPEGADGNAARLIVNEKVNARILQLKSDTAEKCDMTRADYALWLKRAMESKEMTSPQLKAAELLGKVLDFFSPDKLMVDTGDTLTDFLKRLRNK